jgi:hypothetical protein
MKKILLFVLSLFFYSTVIVAQNANVITNHSFENWSTQSVLFSQIETPDNWTPLMLNIDTMGLTFSYPISNVKKTADAYDGQYAAVLETEQFNPLVLATLESLGMSDVTFMPAMMTVGGLNILAVSRDLFAMLSDSELDITSLMQTFMMSDLSDYFYGGLPLNGLKPTALQGYYKYLTASDTIEDEAMVMLIGSYYDAASKSRKLSGIGAAILPIAEEYQEFSVAYFSFSPMPADSMEIVFMSSQLSTMSLGSKLYLDNLSLVGQTDIIDASVQGNGVSCYPNPSKGSVVLSLENDTPATINIYNMAGQKVLVQSDCVDGTIFSLNESGLYTMEVLQGANKEIIKVVIK